MIYMMGVSWDQLAKRLYVVKNHAATTRQGQRARFNIINEFFMHVPFTESTLYDFIATLHTKQLANGTINNYAKLLKHICALLQVDYMRDFTYRPDKGTHIVAWTQGELEKLIVCAYASSFREGVIVETLCKTALRNSELCNLEIPDFTGSEFILRETKSQELQYAPVLPSLAQKITTLIKEVKTNYIHSYIFGCYKGKLYRDTLNDYIRKAAKRTGIAKDIRAHIIRHSICTLATKRNTSIFKVQKFMRHKHVGTTLRYTHLDKDDVREVAETIATESMSFEVLSARIKAFKDQFPHLPYKISLIESENKIVLEVCNTPS